MPLLKRRQRPTAEIPTSSMADVAFLLLSFFLMVTTIDSDSGIYMELPPILENVDPPRIEQRNLLNVLVNREGQVLVDGEQMALGDIRRQVVRHITNNGSDPNLSESPTKAIVSFKTERAAQYEMYVEVLDEIRSAYNEVRNELARSQFGAPDYKTYRERIGEDGEDEVAKTYPLKISLAEPDAGTPGS